MTKALLRRVRKIEQAPPSADACRRGLQNYFESQELPKQAKVREHVKLVLAFLDEASQMTCGANYERRS